MQIQKHRFILLLALAIALTSSLTYAYAQAQTYYINAYSGYSDYDYLIFNVGSTYYAKNGKTGSIDYSSVLGSTVIQYTLNTLTSGGVISLSKGYFYINTKITIPYAHTTIRGEGKEITVLVSTGNTAIEWDSLNWISIQDLSLNGNNAIGTIGLNISGYSSANGFCTLKNLEIRDFDQGIRSYYLMDSHLENIMVSSCASGIVFSGWCMNDFMYDVNIKVCTTVAISFENNDQRCEGISWFGGLVYGNAKALQIYDHDALLIDGVIFDGNNGTIPYDIMGGLHIHFNNCYFAGVSGQNGRFRIIPESAEIYDITFYGCTFTTLQYYGLQIYKDVVSSRRPSDIVISSSSFEANGVNSDGGDVLITDTDRVKFVTNNFRSTIPPRNVAETGTPTNTTFIANDFALLSSGIDPVAGTNLFSCNTGYIP